jgi:hypothetical protein
MRRLLLAGAAAAAPFLFAGGAQAQSPHFAMIDGERAVFDARTRSASPSSRIGVDRRAWRHGHARGWRNADVYAYHGGSYRRVGPRFADVYAYSPYRTYDHGYGPAGYAYGPAIGLSAPGISFGFGAPAYRYGYGGYGYGGWGGPGPSFSVGVGW